MKKLPQILLMFLLLAVGITKAQTRTDVYEYSEVTLVFGPSGPYIAASFSNGEYKEQKLDKNDFKPGGIGINTVPVLKYISELSKDGWEVVNFTAGREGNAGLPGFLLKRKQKESK